MSVTKFYDRLNPNERVAALLLALVRGDDLETQRLNATAPHRTERRCHHHDRAKAVWSLSAMVRIQQLETLADLWHAQARLAWATDNVEPNGDDINGDARLWKAFADVSLWRLAMNQEAWGIVSERLGITPEFLDTFGDCISLKLTEARLGDNLPTADTVREQLAEFGEAVELTTAERIASGWWAVFSALSD